MPNKQKTHNERNLPSLHAEQVFLETEAHYRRTVKALWKVTRHILETLDFKEVSQKICDSLLVELGYLELGYRIIVLSLYDEKAGGLRRISLSQTPQAKAAMDASTIPFHDIVIPLTATKNYCVRAFLDQKPYVTEDWKDILSPPLTPKAARRNQKAAGIKTSMVFPVTLRKKSVGFVIFSMVKKESEVSDTEIDLINSFTDIVGIAIQNARLFSDLQETTNHLNEANEKLKELDKLKDEFISITSHELRTPMTAIKGYLWLLLKEKVEPLPPKAREYLTRVYDSSERLINMVNDMLDVSRIASGKVRLNNEPFNMVTLAEEIQQMFLGRAMQKGLKISVKGGKTIPLITGDREKLHQVLGNLIGNSLKFTPRGGKITIVVKRIKDAVAVSVVDTGIGIHKDDIPKLFRKFGRVDKSLVPLPGVGTGLGLYISKQFVTMHGGKIDVTSTPGHGTTFTISLPIT